jgi:hypothetical protein
VGSGVSSEGQRFNTDLLCDATDQAGPELELQALVSHLPEAPHLKVSIDRVYLPEMQYLLGSFGLPSSYHVVRTWT